MRIVSTLLPNRRCLMVEPSVVPLVVTMTTAATALRRLPIKLPSLVRRNNNKIGSPQTLVRGTLLRSSRVHKMNFTDIGLGPLMVVFISVSVCRSRKAR